MYRAWNGKKNIKVAILFNFAVILNGMTILPFFWFFPTLFKKKTNF